MPNSLEGLAECVTGLENIGNELFEEIDTILADSAVRMLSRAVELCPVNTGLLASSLETKKVYKDQAVVRYVVESDVEYAICVEYGTENMEAQPYLRPSLDEVRGNLKLDLKALQ